MNFGRITAAEYLEASRASGSNESSLTFFRQLKQELERHPDSKERLAFEFLEMTSDALTNGSDPSLGGYAFHLNGSVVSCRKNEYLVFMGKLIQRLFTAMQHMTADQNVEGYAFALRLALSTIRGMDERLFWATAKTLEDDINSESKLLRKILKEAQQSIAQMDDAIKELGRQAHNKQIEDERRLASFKN